MNCRGEECFVDVLTAELYTSTAQFQVFLSTLIENLLPNMILSKEIINIYKYDLIVADIRTGRNLKDALHPDSMSNDPDIFSELR
jgi:hypothetical protein